MSKIAVGIIEGYPVLYIPEKDCVFCKNTVVNRKLIQTLIDSPNLKETVVEKSLTISKHPTEIYLGCLHTNRENLSEIERNINNILLTKKA